MNKENLLGRCIGEALPTAVEFISKKMPKVGEYVVLEYEDKKVLGMIDSLVRGSVSITDEIYDPEVVEKIKAIEGEDYYIRGAVRILGDLKDLKIPRTPPPPGTEILRARDEDLAKVFGKPEKGLRLGTLITHSGVPVYVDIKLMVTRHLAILAMTGAGKSNTVAIIAEGLLKHNGCVIIFDMHSEYVNAKFTNGRVKNITTKINPQHLTFYELSKLAHIGEKAYVQERYFRMAFNRTDGELKNGVINSNKFLNRMIEILHEYLLDEQYKNDKKNIVAVINKLEYLIEQYNYLFESNISDMVDEIELNAINVVDLGTLDEDAADVVVSHMLRKILDLRKKYIKEGEGLAFPVFIILEEAHILAPISRATSSNYWISRIAREGRKFGVGLCLVSQSPKSLDSEA
ncbi:MAG: helicase HerA domain-containing protein, partial [Candidatus Odinarchaeia archaeon]